jgi:hypothetical protein
VAYVTDIKVVKRGGKTLKIENEREVHPFCFCDLGVFDLNKVEDYILAFQWQSAIVNYTRAIAKELFKATEIMVPVKVGDSFRKSLGYMTTSDSTPLRYYGKLEDKVFELVHQMVILNLCDFAYFLCRIPILGQVTTSFSQQLNLFMRNIHHKKLS